MLRRSSLRFFSIVGLVLCLFQAWPIASTEVLAANRSTPLPRSGSIVPNVPFSGAISVTTRNYDQQRSGGNPYETVLNTTNVTNTTFGKLFQRQVDGDIYAQPLYLSNVNIGYERNVVYVATEHNSVYAFDADDPNASTPLWQVNLGTSAHNATQDYGLRYGVPYHDIQKEVGITGTPVMDPANGILYLVSFNCVTSASGAIPPTFCDSNAITVTVPHSYRHYLHALNVKTGAEMPNSPIEITGQVDGNGAGSQVVTVTTSPLVTNTIIPFSSKQHLQRGALSLVNGNLYIPFSGYADTNPYHGWVFVYDPLSLQQTGIWNTTPTSGKPVPGSQDKDGEGGIWQGGGGMAADSAGSLYVMTGNGTYDANNPTYGGNPAWVGDPTKENYADSFVKLDTRHNTVVPIDNFSPTCQLWMQNADADLGSGGSMVMPGTNLVIGVGKQGNIYVLDSTSMGGYTPPANFTNSVSDCYDSGELQKIKDRINTFSGSVGVPAVNGGMYGTPVFWDSPTGKRIYTWGQYDRLKAYQMNSSTTFSHTAVAVGPVGLSGQMPGGVLSVSSNGNQSGTGIIWATHPLTTTGSANATTRPGILEAYNAETLQQLWTSEQNSARDSLNTGDGTNPSYFGKFNPVTVANGKVYVATFAPGGTTTQPSLNLGKPAFLMVYGLLASQVTKATDDGQLGSLSYALSHSPANQIISLSPTTTTTISISNPLPAVAPGLTLKGSCSNGPGVTIAYTGSAAGVNGLTLSNNDWLYGVWVRGFSGVQIKAPNGGGNVFNCVKSSKS